MFANFLKIKNEISHSHKYSDPLLSTLPKHLWQRLQPWVFLGMTLQAWHTSISEVSSLQIVSNSVRLDWEHCCAAISRSLQRCWIRFKSGLWLGHSRTFRDLSLSHFCVVLAVCLGSLSRCKVNLHPSLRSWTLCSTFSSRISLYFAPFIFPSILTSLPVTAAEKHPHSMMLPPPSFTVDGEWCQVSSRRDTWHLAFRPKSSIVASSDQRIFRCLLANSKRAVMCFFTEEWFPSGHSTTKAWLVESCGDGCLSERFSQST